MKSFIGTGSDSFASNSRAEIKVQGTADEERRSVILREDPVKIPGEPSNPVIHSVMERRSFLKSAGALAAPAIIPAAALGREGRTAPSERVTIGLVGAGGKGYDLMRDFYSQCKDEVQFVAIADPDASHAERGKRLAEKNWGEGCRTYRDFRELCARDDLDAVVVATPDHWHADVSLPGTAMQLLCAHLRVSPIFRRHL